jgi:hypothetical protein
MRFGTWNVRSLYRASSPVTVNTTKERKKKEISRIIET